MRYDDSISAPFIDTIRTNTNTNYLVNKNNWGTGNWKKKSDPGFSNTIAIVTGHKYRIHWGKTGINFENLSIKIDENWLDTDKDIYFVHNFSDVRAAIDVRFNGKLIANDTIPANPTDYYVGQNLVRNITDRGSKEE
jgi:hypothetical protein